MRSRSKKLIKNVAIYSVFAIAVITAIVLVIIDDNSQPKPKELSVNYNLPKDWGNAQPSEIQPLGSEKQDNTDMPRQAKKGVENIVGTTKTRIKTTKEDFSSNQLNDKLPVLPTIQITETRGITNHIEPLQIPTVKIREEKIRARKKCA